MLTDREPVLLCDSEQIYLTFPGLSFPIYEMGYYSFLQVKKKG